MKQFKILEWFDSPQIKWYMNELPQELPHNLQLRPSTQSPLQKKTLVLVVKTFTKTDIKVSHPDQCCRIP